MSRPDNSHFDLIQVSKVLVDRWRRAGRSRERGEGEMDLGVCGNDISKQNTKCSGDMCCGILWSDIYYWRSGPVERLNKDEQKMNNFVKYVTSLQTNLIGGGLRLSELHARNCQCLDVTLLRTPFGCWCWLSHVTIVESSHLDMFCFCSLRCTQFGNKTLFHYTEHYTETLRLQSAVYKFNNLQSQRIHVIENWK